MVMTIIIKIVITIISIVFTMNIATYLYVLLLWFRRGKGPGAVAGEVEVAVVALFLERLVTLLGGNSTLTWETFCWAEKSSEDDHGIWEPR